MAPSQTIRRDSRWEMQEMFYPMRHDYGKDFYMARMMGSPAFVMTHNPKDFQVVT